MATPFATLANVLSLGLPLSALGTLSLADQQACVDFGNGDVGSRLNGRYPGINQGGSGWTWDESVRGYAVAIIWKRILDKRGRQAGLASDKLIDDNYKEAIEWFNDVQKQAKHPYITGGEAAGGTSQGPVVVSSSATHTGSCYRGANRGI